MLADLRSSGDRSEPSSNSPAPSGENLVHQLWKNLEPNLQDALALAFNQARREGKNRISTRTFFAAVARLKPGQLSRLIDVLPKGSLPDPIAADVPVDRHILEEEPLLSSCVENALLGLSKQAGPDRRLGAEDVFVDVAKHGTGESVARLRAHGLTPPQIDRIIGQFGWRVVRRG